MARKAASSLLCTRAGMRATRWTKGFMIRIEQAQQIAPKLLGTKSHTEILHPQNAALIDDRCEEGMVHVTVWRLCREHAGAVRETT